MTNKTLTINVVGVTALGKTTLVRLISRALQDAGMVVGVEINETCADDHSHYQPLREYALIQRLEEGKLSIVINEVQVPRSFTTGDATYEGD